MLLDYDHESPGKMLRLMAAERARIKDPRRKRRGIQKRANWRFSCSFWYSWPCFLT
jgi:hypothetical protein